MSTASAFSSICFERGCWFKGERKVRVADKRVKKLTLGSHIASPSSMSFRVSASSSAKPEKDIKIGLLGASGYTGAEIVRLLANHPHFEVTLMTADRKAGQSMESVFPHLRAQKLPSLISVKDADFSAVDAVFCCLPHGTTQEIIKELPSALKIVDLSADFRLRDISEYEEWYGQPHKAKEVVYGLTEILREDIKKARLVANPGCYPTSIQLPLVPLIKANLIKHENIIIDAKSGVSGAGRGAKEANLYSEIAEGISSYGVTRHRHVPEIEQGLSDVAQSKVTVSFTPHLMPMIRGMQSTIYVEMAPGEKIGGKVIYRRGGVLFLFRGRNYNHRTRPRFPLMLWKPVAPVYPRLIQQVPEGLTHQEAAEMRRKGRELMPICKLGKNGVYCDLVKNVKEAFEVCELVRIDCQGMKGSDFRKIGAKLKDLVPCVLISFQNEQILIWRGREWKSSLTTPDKKDDILGDIEVDTALSEDDEQSISPNQTQTVTQNSSLGSMELQDDPDGHDLSPSTVDSSAMEGTSSSLESSSKEDVTELTADSSFGDHQEPENESETSEEISKQSIERVLNLMKQAVESETAIMLDDTDLDADTVFAKAVAFSTVAAPGPVFQHGVRKQPAVKKQESQEPPGYRNLEAKTSNVVVTGKKEVAVRVERDEKKEEGPKKKMIEFDEDYKEVIPHGTLKVDELAKLLA